MEATQFETTQQTEHGSGETVWSLFWYVMKWVFFVFLMIMVMKYFYDMNRKKQAADKLAALEKDNASTGSADDEEDDKED